MVALCCITFHVLLSMMRTASAVKVILFHVDSGELSSSHFTLIMFERSLQQIIVRIVDTDNKIVVINNKVIDI